MTAADREAANSRQRARTVALWRWALIEPAMDAALTSRHHRPVMRHEVAVRREALGTEGGGRPPRWAVAAVWWELSAV